MAFLEWFVDSKWEREYQKYLNEKNYSSAKEVLNSKADKDVTKDVAEKYIELWEVSEDYSGAEEVIERYSEKLSDIGDEKVVFYSSQKNPFSKSGSYFLRYVESSETKTLINDNGFERTVPVYYLLDDTIDLNERYENWYRIKEEKQQEEDKLKRLVALK